MEDWHLYKKSSLDSYSQTQNEAILFDNHMSGFSGTSLFSQRS